MATVSATPRAKKPSAKPLIRQYWKQGTVAAVALVLAILYPYAGGLIAKRMISRKVAARTSLVMTIGSARAGLTQVTFFDVSLTDDPDVQIHVARITVPVRAAWGGGTVWLEAPELKASSIAALKKVRSRSTEAATSPRAVRTGPSLGFAHGRVLIGAPDAKVFWADQITGSVAPNTAATVTLANLEGHAAGMLGGKGLEVGGFGARKVHLSLPLSGLRVAGLPSVTVADGFVQALPALGLSGISGQIAPKSKGAGRDGASILMFSGSYGGAQERLWNAAGEFRLGKSWQDSEGTFGLRAERFMLDRIKNVLPPTVKSPERTSIGGGLGIRLHSGVFEIKSNLDVVDLSVYHAALASAPVEHLSVSFRVDATLDPTARVLDIKQIEGRLRDLVGTLSGRIELAPGAYTFKDGRSWPWIPKIALTLDVPQLPCDKMLASFPRALVPRLAGFSMRGNFETHLETQIDYSDLEAMTLDGQVGIGGCKVQSVPSHVADLANADLPITQTVKVPPPWDEKGRETQELVFVVGADSEDFAPFAEVSPYLVNAFLTTEDSSFFKHHGFATREFRVALKRNLENGRFKQGASSITMQMVKNLLLSHEKTLSRKLQELFLVWHLEHVLPKERILELYLNAIEFGPRLYGIGPASRHYFGKEPSLLNPLEAAFFSSILPSPKRRYVHYCRGGISPAWDKYVRRILGFMHKRGRLTDEELQQWLAEPLVFDLQSRTMTERQCLDWVARMTANPKPDVEPPEDAEVRE